MTAAGEVTLGRACRSLMSLKWNLLLNGLRGRMQLRVQTIVSLLASVALGLFGLAAFAGIGQSIAHGDLVVVIALPVHPNPRVAVPVRAALGDHPAICLLDPLDYAEFVTMLGRAEIVLTDSGGVQEEAPALGKPVLVLRDTTERPEGVAAGCARLIGLDSGRIVEEATRLLDDPEAYRAMSKVANPYGDGTASRQIADAILTRAQTAHTRAVGT